MGGSFLRSRTTLLLIRAFTMEHCGSPMKRRPKAPSNSMKRPSICSERTGIRAGRYSRLTALVLGPFFLGDMSQRHSPTIMSPAGWLRCFSRDDVLAALFVAGTRGAFRRAGAALVVEPGTRLGFLQIALQPTKFLVLPVASLSCCHSPARMLYQNLMAVRDGDRPAFRKLRRARKQAFVWHRKTGRCSRFWPSGGGGFYKRRCAILIAISGEAAARLENCSRAVPCHHEFNFFRPHRSHVSNYNRWPSSLPARYSTLNR